MKKILVVVAAMGFASVAIAGEHPGKGAEHAGKPAEHAGKPADAGKKTGLIKHQSATWQPLGDPKTGPWMSVVSGDPKTGPFTMFLKQKAGSSTGWHTHNEYATGVLLEGTATYQEQGGEVFKPSVGQAFVPAAGVNHENKCLGKKDCILFIASPVAMSFNPMTADGKKMDMPAAAAPAAAAPAAAAPAAAAKTN